jgi:reactive chlorine resistance protein C
LRIGIDRDRWLDGVFEGEGKRICRAFGSRSVGKAPKMQVQLLNDEEPTKPRSVPDYEADGIVPLVANSPLMSFFYHYPAPEYRQYMNKEGEVIPAYQQWHESNGTYSFSHGLGVVIVLIGVLIAAYPILPQVSAVDSFLLILMSLTTLSFLVTTPEAWVPALGASTHGFPYLSGAGRLIIKDAIMLGAAVVTLADSARTWLASSRRLSRNAFIDGNPS